MDPHSVNKDVTPTMTTSIRQPRPSCSDEDAITGSSEITAAAMATQQISVIQFIMFMAIAGGCEMLISGLRCEATDDRWREKWEWERCVMDDVSDVCVC